MMAAGGGIEPPNLSCQQQVAFAYFATPHLSRAFISRVIPIPPPNLGKKS